MGHGGEGQGREGHPCGPQVHADQRAGRPLRPAPRRSDIAFLGGIINYVLTTEKYFRDYVVAYTNAATILTERYADTEDLDGVFSGLDEENRKYDFSTWQYEGLEVQAMSGEADEEYEDRTGSSARARPGAARRTDRVARPSPPARRNATRP